MKYYEKRIPHLIFVVCSDDTEYAKSVFSKYTNVFVRGEWLEGSLLLLYRVFFLVENGTPAEDMALLASCSHSIMTMGSFGFWSSFLTGGQVVYAYIPFRINVPFVHRTRFGLGYRNFVGLLHSKNHTLS